MNRMKKCLTGLVFLFVIAVSAAAVDKTANDLVADATKEIKSVTAQEAKQMLDVGGVVVIDVREMDEYDVERIPQAVFIPRGMLEFQLPGKYPKKDTAMIVYCLKGGRGALASQTLKIMGYTNVVNLTGGLVAWQAAKFPTEKGKK